MHLLHALPDGDSSAHLWTSTFRVYPLITTPPPHPPPTGAHVSLLILSTAENFSPCMPLLHDCSTSQIVFAFHRGSCSCRNPKLFHVASHLAFLKTPMHASGNNSVTNASCSTSSCQTIVLMWSCRHVCPYHASRDVLNEGAALVFVTYSQLLDPPVRSANGLDDLIKGAVLVFDEVLPNSVAVILRCSPVPYITTPVP